MKAALALVLVLLALPSACRRVDHDAIARAKADLAGAWLRVAEGGDAPQETGDPRDGFDLRADGSLGVLGNDALAGIAWNRVRDELVISTSGEHDAQPRSSRLEIASLDGDLLDLRGGADSEHFAGRYRRTPVEHVSGVVTYLEQVALPAGARIEVRLARGGAPAAFTRVPPRATLPFPFTVSVLPAAGAPGDATLEATVHAGGKLMFATPAPVPVEIGARDVELLLRQPPPPR